MAATLSLRPREMKTVLAIAVAGSLGVVARYGVDGLISSRLATPFPWATILINVSGAFVLGLLFASLGERGGAPDWLRLALTVGFLGGFTTFSTFSLQTFILIEAGAYGLALVYSLGSVIAGVVAAYAGVWLGRTL